MLICSFLYDKINIHFYYIFLRFFIMFNYFSYFSSEQGANFRDFITENYQNTELITSRLMLVMGFKMHLRGATYLREAIEYRFKLPLGEKISFSKTVYPSVASAHNTKAHNVDRDIRTAIQCCYQYGKMFIFNEICGCEMIFNQYAPTNSEFIMNVVTWLHVIEMECSKQR